MRPAGARTALLAITVAAASLAGCQAVVDQGVGLVVGSRPLRAQAQPAEACMEALLSGILEGDLSDPSLVWLQSDGRRTDLTWPFGFRVRFNPGAEVLAPGGRVVAREGDAVSLGGGTITDTFEICTVDGEEFLGTAR